jgi:hypothetical protein
MAESVVASWAATRTPPSLSCRVSQTEVIQRLWGGFGILARVRIECGQHTESQASVSGCIVISSTAPVVSELAQLTLPPPVVVCKLIKLPKELVRALRYGQLEVGDRRKLRSYSVEAFFYDKIASLLPPEAVVPKSFAVSVNFQQRDRCMQCDGSPSSTTPTYCDDMASSFLVLEDLALAGFVDSRPSRTNGSVIRGALRWLAALHGRFVLHPGQDYANALSGLWPRGQYFALNTRQEELERIPRGTFFRDYAAAIDLQLAAVPQTICHGDAKLPNFVFVRAGIDDNNAVRRAAAVDFQYSGGGCGVVDVAYLLHSTVEKHFPHHSALDVRAGAPNTPTSADADQAEYHRWRGIVDPLLDFYFAELAGQMAKSQTASDAGSREVDSTGAALEDRIVSVVNAWREVFELAYLEYWRFYLGWASEHIPSPDADDDQVLAAVPAFVRHMVRIVRPLLKDSTAAGTG